MTVEELSTAKEAVLELWEDEYARISVDTQDITIDVAPPKVSNSLLLIPYLN
jgi:hypothetical protein